MTAERAMSQAAIASSCLLWSQGPIGQGQHLIFMRLQKRTTVPPSASAEKGGLLVIPCFCFFKKLFFSAYKSNLFSIENLTIQNSVEKKLKITNSSRSLRESLLILWSIFFSRFPTYNLYIWGHIVYQLQYSTFSTSVYIRNNFPWLKNSYETLSF